MPSKSIIYLYVSHLLDTPRRKRVGIRGYGKAGGHIAGGARITLPLTRPSCYSAAISAQQTIALQTELHRPYAL